MADLPKIVRERLQAAAADAHPDADLLAAFAEKRLGERERALVLDHLAACSTCREVVALARPEEEKQAAAAPLPAPWWGLRWQTAAALATVAVAAVALLIIPNTFFRSGRSTGPQVAQAPAEKPAATREQAKAPSAETATLAPAKKAAAKKETTATGGGMGGAASEVSRELAKAQAGAPEATDRFGKVPSSRTQKQVSALEAPAPSVKPGVSGAAAADRAAAAPAPPPPAAVGGVATGQGAGQQANGELRRAPATAETVEVQAEATPVTIVPQWRTTAKGKLERSRDSGRSWHTVNVAPGAALNAVSAAGGSVWAGGHQQHVAVLYYSADSGAHWSRLEFSGPAGAQAANIVALSFSDAQHGAMTVITAEDPRLRQIWTTSDGGRTWTRPGS